MNIDPDANSPAQHRTKIQMQVLPACQLLTIGDMCRIFGTSRSSIERYVRSNVRFPQPLRLGQRGVRFRAGDVMRFIESAPNIKYIDHAFDPNDHDTDE